MILLLWVPFRSLFLFLCKTFVWIIICKWKTNSDCKLEREYLKLHFIDIITQAVINKRGCRIRRHYRPVSIVSVILIMMKVMMIQEPALVTISALGNAHVKNANCAHVKAKFSCAHTSTLFEVLKECHWNRKLKPNEGQWFLSSFCNWRLLPVTRCDWCTERYWSDIKNHGKKQTPFWKHKSIVFKVGDYFTFRSGALLEQTIV